MTLHRLAGKPAPESALIDVARLEREYFERQPDTADPRQLVSFGTSGHRGSSMNGTFTESHILAITQAICDYRRSQRINGPIYMGKDTHGLSGPAQSTALEVLAANGAEAFIQQDDGETPTPVISHAIIVHNQEGRGGVADGVVITPSHNPPEDGGFKYNPPHGGPAETEVTKWVEKRANELLRSGNRGVARMPYAAALKASTTHQTDFIPGYVKDLKHVVDLDAIRAADLSLAVDPLGGASLHYWERIKETWRLRLKITNDKIDPTFRFMTLDHDGKIRMDCSSPYAMAGLRKLKSRYSVAFANDPDADRHGIVTPSAGLMNPNHYLAVAIHYLLANRPVWPKGAGVGKTLVSSSMIDLVVKAGGRRLVEVPVGFKWFAPGLLDGSICFGGEESAGASFLGYDGSVWTTDKDGILLALLAGEITARTGKEPGLHYKELTSEFGTPYYTRVDAPATREEKARLQKLSADDVKAGQMAGEPVVAVLTRAPGNNEPIGGLKVVTKNGWFAARPSGTEDIYKIYAESLTSQSHLDAIVNEARRIVAEALAGAEKEQHTRANPKGHRRDDLETGACTNRNNTENATNMRKTLTKSRARMSAVMRKSGGRRMAGLRAERAMADSAKGPLDAKLLRKMDAWWRAANYLSIGQTYLYDNPLLKKPLKEEHIKPRLVGHWGTTPGLNFIYVHLNRLIKQRDLNMIYIIGPGHGGPGIVANTWLEGTYSEIYPNISQDEEGMKKMFKQFSFPGGIPSHVAPETPGSIHEGGELGYALSHAFGAAYDNPGLIVAAVVGDGEAETGPLATSWHSNKFLNPASDGAVLPILHLNGYKIANPCVLARITHEELSQLFRGYGYTPIFVEGDEPAKMHQLMAAALDQAISDIQRIQSLARENGSIERPRWPMIILRSPKGWTCPKVIDGKPAEGSWRAHQVPMGEMHEKPAHVKILERWMKSYRPEELFDRNGRFKPELAELAPKAERRMSANPHANGGLLLRDLCMPDFRDYAVPVKKPGATDAEATRVMGKFLRDVMKSNMGSKNFRLFSPDENNSNRWQDVLDVTNRAWMAQKFPYDDHLAPDGRVMEMLSEHQCQGWLEGYLLTGRHGFFSCYEAFIHIIDSMFNQHAKWLKVCNHIPWRRPIASLNYLLSSHVWRQDHNGFSHQDPGFIDHVVNKKAEVVRVYLPPDANCLLSVTDHCLRSRNYINVVVAGKQPAPVWLTMDEAIKHCTAGIGIWEWASSDKGSEPDVVMACCGDVPTLETLAAVELLRGHAPELKVRVINVVNLMKLQPASEHPHGLSDKDFDTLFTKDKPIVFAFHGYPWLIHRLTYRRTNHKNLHVRGYKEEGTTTTPFDMVVLNELDRFHLVQDVIDRLPQLSSRAAYAKQAIRNALIEHRQYINDCGEDHPMVLDWRWGGKSATGRRRSSTESDNV